MMFNTTYETLPLMELNSGHRHPRFGFLPIVGLLLANLFSNSIAKYAPPGSFHLSYDPVSWLKPLSHESYWNGVTNPYGPPSPDDSTEPQYIHHHHHVIQPSNQQQIINIIEEDADDDSTPQVVLEERQSGSIEKPVAQERSLNGTFPTALNYTSIDARAIVKRGVANRYVKVRNNNKYYNRNRKRTTTPDYYYDSYEESSTRKGNSRRKPRPTRRPVNSYEDFESNSYSDNYSDYYEYPSYELTTKSKRRRTTTTTERPRRIKNKNKNKNRKRQKVVTLEDYNDEGDYDDYESVVEQTSVAQRQHTTRPSTPTTITAASTTTSPTTTTIQTELTSGITSTTVEETSTTPSPTVPTGYGYGPSNGNDNISLTYGPPTQAEDNHNPYGTRPQTLYGPPSQSYGPSKPASPAYSAPIGGYYQVPFSDWYSGETKRNSIVKKIHDIVGFENILQRK